MPFRLAIVRAASGPATADVDVELPDADEPLLVADAACELLSERGTRFAAGGFGDPAWRVDVYTDLAVIIPQLADVTHDLIERVDTELAFYEQGVERTVFFTSAADGHQVALRCASYGNWVPPEPEETASRTALLDMLRAFQYDIADEVRTFWPELSSLAPFNEWLRAGPA